MKAQNFGFEKVRFPNMQGDQFNCVICFQVVKDPKECPGCGNMYCQICIDSWMAKNKECPSKCNPVSNKITVISKALSRIYNDLDIKCSYFDICKKTLKMYDLNEHEKKCNVQYCKNFDVCKNNAQNNTDVCDQSCFLLLKLKQAGANQKQQLTEIQTFLSQFKNTMRDSQVAQNQVQSQIGNPQINSNQKVNVNGQHKFKWSLKNKGTGMEVTDNGLKVWLKESAYMFRTIVSDIPFMNGVHYWEIIADDRTENELKIGITTKPDFNYNTSFSDFEYGYAFYGLGQLRHNSNAQGSQYGKRFKKEGVLGCFLNMNKGQFSFALNGEYFGVAFTNAALTKGPILVAVSLLHSAGCSIDSSKPIPAYFPQ